MMSVAGNYDYLELITNSKSGSFFFYSHDQKYIIKNMKVRTLLVKSHESGANALERGKRPGGICSV